MTDSSEHKPTVEEWLRWAHVVDERLHTCAHVYDKPPHEDIFMPEKNRAQRKTNLIDLLQRMRVLTDQTETPSDSIHNAHDHDEQIISGLTTLFQEVLEQLPAVSKDMQHLLKSRWDNHCNGRIASELFRGRESEQEGIGTGMPEHGRLPEVLANLVEREVVGGQRLPRQELLENGEPRRHNDESRRRWAGNYLRSAGRVD